MRVVLPAPLGPRTPKMAPGTTSRSTCVSTCLPGTEKPFPKGLADALCRNSRLHNYMIRFVSLDTVNHINYKERCNDQN